MKKRKTTSFVCDQEDSRSFGFQCVKGFTMEHRRGGITSHCKRCMGEEKGDA